MLNKDLNHCHLCASDGLALIIGRVSRSSQFVGMGEGLVGAGSVPSKVGRSSSATVTP